MMKNTLHSIITQPLRRPQKGQNLVEFALVLPFLLIGIFFVVEMGRVWQTYEGAKMAAEDGAYTAASRDSAVQGNTVINQRLSAANIVGNGNIRPIMGFGTIPTRIGYKAQVNVNYQPLFGGIALTLPVVGINVPIIPANFPIQYDSIYYSRLS